MKLRLTLIFLLVSFMSLKAYSNDVVTLLKEISGLRCNSQIVSEQIKFLKQLEGDTIALTFIEDKYSNLLTTENPDTIWINGHSVPNPSWGSDYALSYNYKATLVGDKFLTPTDSLKNKQFAVHTVKIIHSSPVHNDIFLKLIDLSNLSIVNLRLPATYKVKMSIESTKCDKLRKAVLNKPFAVKKDKYSPKYYDLITIKECAYSINIEGGSSFYVVRSDFKFKCSDKNTKDYKFDLSGLSDESWDKNIIPSNVYYADYAKRCIFSNSDTMLLASKTPMPFSFNRIIAVPIDSERYISQTITPQEVQDSRWDSDCKTAPEEVMMVGGVETVNNVKFYKMIHKGKAFFMRASDLKFSKEGMLKMDSLENAYREIQDIFFHKCLAMSKIQYGQETSKLLKKLNSYSNVGLIVSSIKTIDESEYTEGTGVRIRVYNPTKQMIKYISFTLQGYNAVDDPVGRAITKKCIGPIEPEEEATYSFDYVWFTDIVEYTKLKSISVTYKNGTVKTISKPQKAFLTEELEDYIYGNNPFSDFL